MKTWPTGMAIALVTLALTSGPDAASPAPAVARADDPATVRELYYVALNAGDVHWVMSLCADDAVYEGTDTCRL